MKPTPITPPVDVVEGNKIIAEFMGYYVNTESYSAPVIDLPDGGYYYLYEAKYHSSFDWLMPVVEKVNEVFEKEQCFLQGSFDGDIWRSMNDWILSVSIENAWGDLVQIIQWYNNQKLKP